MSDAILLTGATGLVGTELIAHWLEDDSGPQLFLAVCARDAADAQARVDELLRRLYDEPPAAAARLRPMSADLTAPGLGLTGRDRADVVANVARIVHCAASMSFMVPLEEARAINVGGTREVLAIANEISGLERVVHVSTAYVAGRTPCVFREVDLARCQAFRNSYEQTKHEAEELVATTAGLPIVTVRPSIVVGESDTGWTSVFNVIYWPLQAFARGLFCELFGASEGIVDIVPVDYVVDVLEAATFAPGASGTYSAVAGASALTVAELIALTCRLMDREARALVPGGRLFDDHHAAAIAPYVDVVCRFGDERTRALLGHSAPALSDYFDALLEYAARAHWGKRPLTRQTARICRLPQRKSAC
jgi:thioester reductase-like protein